MAVTLDNLIKNTTIDVIIRSDSAIAEDITDDDFEAYSKTLDETKLRFKHGEEPTRWVMKQQIKHDQQIDIDNAKARVEKGKLIPQLGFIYVEVAASLVDIKNPETVPPDKRLVLKKSGDGTVSPDFLAALGPITQELFTVRQSYMNARKGASTADLKKS